MPNRSVFDDLSPDEIKAIEAEMIRRNFKRIYELEQWCVERGWEITRGPLYTKAKSVKRRLEFVKASTLAMQQVVEVAPDDDAKATGALLALVQADTFDTMLAFQEATEEPDPDKRLARLKDAALIANRVANANVRLKTFQAKTREKLDADLAAIKAAGGDEKTLEAVQQRIAIYLPSNGR